MTNLRLKQLLACALLCIAPCAYSQQQGKWVGTWAAAQQQPEPANALPPEAMQHALLRQVVHVSLGGSQLRIHLSNQFGTTPLHLLAVHVAAVGETPGSIRPETDHALRFNGSPGVTIPAGAEYVTDPVAYSLAPMADLAITIAYDTPTGSETGHPGSRATSYLAAGSDPAVATLQNPRAIAHWYQLAGVDVEAPAATFSIVAFGDSITDGHGATTDGNDRWPDDLARLLHGQAGVLNVGIGGNRLLLDGLGPNALARFDRDVLARAGVREVLLLEGVNDLGTAELAGPASPAAHAVLVSQIEGAYTQFVTWAHAHGLSVTGCTITPYTNSTYYHPDAAEEQDREQINAWILAPGHFDSTVDFAATLRDPAHPTQLLSAYDSGDHLHPSPAGYRAMAQAIPLERFGGSR